jgi:O-antigen/teichoic acid export membrane protein
MANPGLRASSQGPAEITPRRMVAGTLSSLINRLVGLSLAFFVLPLVINAAGAEEYGLWAVMGATVTYFGLLDCGIGSGFIKYLAEFLEFRHHATVRQVMAFGLLFYLGLGVVLLPLAIVGGPHIVAWLQVNGRYEVLASHLLLLAVAYFLLQNALGILNAFIVAMQRTDVAAWIDTIGQIVYAASVVILLHLQYKVLAIPYALFAALLGVTVIRLVLVCRLFGWPFGNPLRLDGHLVKRLFGFGLWTQISMLTAVINLETDRIILGAFVSLTSVTYYELGNRLAQLSRNLPLTLLGPILPAASAIDGRKDDRQLNRIYIRATRYLALATGAIAGLLVAAGPQIVRVWMGREYPWVTAIMAALLLTYAVNNLTGVGTTVVRAVGLPHVETYYAVLAAVVNVVATIVLTPLFGLMGVIAGTLIGSVVGSVYFLWLFHKLRGLGWTEVMGEWLWRLVAGVAIVGAGIWLFCNHVLAPWWFTARPRGMAALIVIGLTYAGVLWAALRALRFWDDDDLALIGRLAPEWLSAWIGAPIGRTKKGSLCA